MCTIRDVWKWNVMEELKAMEQCLYKNRILAIDTEFPGFLEESNLNSLGFMPYSTLKSNVDPTNLIQLGITLLGPLGVVATWSFNFRFDLDLDVHSSTAIQFLRSNGHDFDKLKEDGIDIFHFSRVFRSILANHRGLTWVMFHGLYDVAYLVKIITGRGLPDTGSDFVNLAANVLGTVIDLKFVYRFYNESGRANLGLEKLAKILGVKRIGGAHEAGSDCLLTAAVFVAMKTRFRFDDERFQGFLYGVDSRIPNTHAFRVTRPLIIPIHPPPPPQPHCFIPVFRVAPVRYPTSGIHPVGARFCFA